MNNQHPITPPAHLVNQWFDDNSIDKTVDLLSLATTAAQWGADQELEACCEVLEDERDVLQLLEARREEPSSPKENAITSLYAFCRAMEALIND